MALTFDDGPDATWTPRLLDVLAQRGARATFFPIAPRAQAHPALIARMRDEGHLVGLHCDAHERHSEHDRAWLEQDTVRALARLRGLGLAPRLWRTPWGDTTAWSPQVAAAHGLQIIGWSADTHDWRGDRAQDMFAATAGALSDGAIVLAHDGIGPGARRADARETVAYVQLVADHAEAHGLELSPLWP